jgi:hypothetical protein
MAKLPAPAGVVQFMPGMATVIDDFSTGAVGRANGGCCATVTTGSATRQSSIVITFMSLSSTGLKDTDPF